MPVYSWTVRDRDQNGKPRFTPMRLSGRAMADRESQILARIAPGIATVEAAAWDTLAGASDPFLSRAFLAALEESGSVGEGTGWTPAPILVEGNDGVLASVAPAYLKSTVRANMSSTTAGRTPLSARAAITIPSYRLPCLSLPCREAPAR
jgi:hypothetical protein